MTVFSCKCGDVITPGTMNAEGCRLTHDGWTCGTCVSAEEAARPGIPSPTEAPCRPFVSGQKVNVSFLDDGDPDDLWFSATFVRFSKNKKCVTHVWLCCDGEPAEPYALKDVQLLHPEP